VGESLGLPAVLQVGWGVRRLTLLTAATLQLSCGELDYGFGTTPADPPDPSTTPDTEPSPDDDSDGWTALDDCNDDDASVNPDAAEVCDNGRDDDCDGNADCEDAECLEEAHCFEGECADLADDDDDGLTDCMDPDCWGTDACSKAFARVLGGASLSHAFHSESSACNEDTRSRWSTSAVVLDVWGSFQMPTDAGGWAQCSWEVATAMWQGSGGRTAGDGGGGHAYVIPVIRFGRYLQEDCPETSMGFLPRRLRATRAGAVVATWSAATQSTLWYQGTYLTGSYSAVSDSCRVTSAGGWSFAPLGVGTRYPRE